MYNAAVTDKVECNCHFLDPGWNCMTHHQVLQSFPDTNEVLLHKAKKSTSLFFIAVPAGIREVTVAFSFISEHT
jgi:hypothetical protein